MAACAIAALIAACGSRTPLRADATGIGGEPDGGRADGGSAGTGGPGFPFPDCAGPTVTGQPCTVPAFCTNLRCVQCSDRYWRFARTESCMCDASGAWQCDGDWVGHIDCLYDPPLECDIALVLYEDAACQTHPACSDGGGASGGAGTGGAGTSGGGGEGGGAGTGGTGATAGTSGSIMDCPAPIEAGQPCSAGVMCMNFHCDACSDRYWRRNRGRVPCYCDASAVWMCPTSPGIPLGDCLFEPPLDCETAQVLYEDATCQTHPACEP